MRPCRNFERLASVILLLPTKVELKIAEIMSEFAAQKKVNLGGSFPRLRDAFHNQIMHW